MSSTPNSQLPLTTDPVKLKKSCICLTGARRCTRKRSRANEAGGEDTYNHFLDQVTTYWPNLTPTEQDRAADDLAEYSVCRKCFEDGRRAGVKQGFLSEKATAGVVTPSRSARGLPFRADLPAARASTSPSGSKTGGAEASSGVEVDSSEEVVETVEGDRAGIKDEQNQPVIDDQADNTYASSQTLDNSQLDISTAPEHSSSPMPASSATLAHPPSPARTSNSIQPKFFTAPECSSSPTASSSVITPARSPSPERRRLAFPSKTRSTSSSTAHHETSPPASTSSATATRRRPYHPPAHASSAADAPPRNDRSSSTTQDDQHRKSPHVAETPDKSHGVRAFFDRHGDEMVFFHLGGMCYLGAGAIAFIVWCLSSA